MNPTDPVSFHKVEGKVADAVKHSKDIHNPERVKMLEIAYATNIVCLERIAKGVEKQFLKSSIIPAGDLIVSKKRQGIAGFGKGKIGKKKTEYHIFGEQGKKIRVYPVTSQSLEGGDLLKLGKAPGFLMALKKSKIKSLEKEMGIKANISTNLKKISTNDEEYQHQIKNLDLEFHSTEKTVKGQLGELRMVELAKHGNVESYLKKNFPLDLNVAMDLCRQLMNGMQALHKAGYSHGDLKLDNLLLFEDANGKLVLKITDFGKTKHKDNPGKYSGNIRNCAYEMENSIEADTCSFGFLMVQILEAATLTEKEAKNTLVGNPPQYKNQDPLIAPKRPKLLGLKNESHEDRSPFVKFRCSDKDCLSVDAKDAIKDKKNKLKLLREYFGRVKGLMGRRGAKKRDNHRVKEYINALSSKLQKAYKDTLTERETQLLGSILEKTLKRMTHLQPEKRVNTDLGPLIKDFSDFTKKLRPSPPLSTPPPHE